MLIAVKSGYSSLVSKSKRKNMHDIPVLTNVHKKKT